MKSELMTTVERDAKQKAYARLVQMKSKRGGRFKISEAQFVEELTNMWIAGEFCAGERILRCIEIDETLSTKDLIRGEIHEFILAGYKILKKRMREITEDLKVEDLIYGKFSTDKVVADQELPREMNREMNHDGL